MKLLLCLALMLVPLHLAAQSRTVLPSELELRVTVDETDHLPLTREMVLITIRGVYRRHITREQLVQPDFDGFSWTQLGPDAWREERIDGRKVKTFTRRMAIFPDAPGELTIGPFTHKLTLTDESDDWFDHEITSEPVTIAVAPAPPVDHWWFPVRSLKVEDQWSNAPDQLTPGEGVLRIIRVEALGVTPEMLPPMPDLTSPSAMIFAHPEKRFVELSPQGPVSIGFWRWTIRPSNDTSAIVEPVSFDYFDTTLREMREVTVSAQRVAYGSVVPNAVPPPEAAELVPQYHLPRGLLAALALVIFAGGVAFAQSGRRVGGLRALRRFSMLDPLAWQLRRAARSGAVAETRRTAAAILRRDGMTAGRKELLDRFDREVFAPDSPRQSLGDFAARFLRASCRPAGTQPIRDTQF